MGSKIQNIIKNSYQRKIRKIYIDIHCHCLPGIDDGPANISEALQLCRAMAEEGIATAIATPHQLGRYDNCIKAQDIRQAVKNLNHILKIHKIPLTIVPGAEVRIDERIPQMLKNDELVTLADDKKYILLEFPHNVCIDIEYLLEQLSDLGISAIISHAERIGESARSPEKLYKWLDYAASLQVTASNLLGYAGKKAEKAAWELLAGGWATIVATDAHNISSRRSNFREAYMCIKSHLGRNVANLVCIENPLRVIRGQNVSAVSFAEEVG